MYLIQRAGLFFDTSEIPDDAMIVSANLWFRAYEVWGPPYDYVIVSGDTLREPLIPENYYYLLPATVSLGSTPRDWYKRLYTIDLNALGLAKINTKGITKLALRTSRDIDTIQPTGWENTRIYAAETCYKPHLTVSYWKP
ncbi:hypothetical protein ES703_71612 [subsurface metagenome]